ncbi:hypothetical protein N177_2289 [Lutibaculum baratangense AMV1]|uniref:Uncharacterized protein n=1 Tax=Lutibaculum baratangense AMV1 TaxID=631454 RepID=V4RFP3_9HYPH|nr:hypothetical protein N177_2289 [Lutibaculum baratangense AMV1]
MDLAHLREGHAAHHEASLATGRRIAEQAHLRLGLLRLPLGRCRGQRGDALALRGQRRRGKEAVDHARERLNRRRVGLGELLLPPDHEAANGIVLLDHVGEHLFCLEREVHARLVRIGRGADDAEVTEDERARAGEGEDDDRERDRQLAGGREIPHLLAFETFLPAWLMSRERTLPSKNGPDRDGNGTSSPSSSLRGRESGLL